MKHRISSISRTDNNFPNANRNDVNEVIPIYTWSVVGSIDFIDTNEKLYSGKKLIGKILVSRKWEEDFRYSEEKSFDMFPIKDANLISMFAFDEINIAGPILAKFEILEIP